jgi:hypothetical protein
MMINPGLSNSAPQLPNFGYCVYTSLTRHQNPAFRPPSPPNSGGNRSSKSPKIGGFRGHSRIYARDTMRCAHNARMKIVLPLEGFTELTPDIIRLKIEYSSISPIADRNG